MTFHRTTGEFLPFFLCKGVMSGVYTASIGYSDQTVDAKGNIRNSTRTVQTQPQRYDSVFQENKSQIYGGYKFSNRRVSRILKHESNFLQMQKVSEVDFGSFSINDFEMSTTTLRAVLKDEVIVQATKETEQYVRSFHPTANSVDIKFSQFTVEVHDVYPVFLPCYISDVEYDGERYTMYTSGRDATLTTGPYLLSGIALGRAGTLATVGLSLLLAPSKVLGLVVGSMLSVPIYYAAYYASRHIPIHIRDRNRKARAQRQADYVENDAHGFRPGRFSQRMVHDEKQSSEQRRQKHQQEPRFSSEGAVRDSKGYYKLLGLNGNEQVDSIRQAFRKRALKHHPDAGGDPEDMKRLNEAYRVLRNVDTRHEYDRS